jgi:hypothetical protein
MRANNVDEDEPANEFRMTHPHFKRALRWVDISPEARMRWRKKYRIHLAEIKA